MYYQFGLAWFCFIVFTKNIALKRGTHKINAYFMALELDEALTLHTNYNKINLSNLLPAQWKIESSKSTYDLVCGTVVSSFKCLDTLILKLTLTTMYRV